MLRVDSLGLELRHQQTVVQSCGMKLVYMEQTGKVGVVRGTSVLGPPRIAAHPVSHVSRGMWRQVYVWELAITE